MYVLCTLGYIGADDPISGDQRWSQEWGTFFDLTVRWLTLTTRLRGSIYAQAGLRTCKIDHLEVDIGGKLSHSLLKIDSFFYEYSVERTSPLITVTASSLIILDEDYKPPISESAHRQTVSILTIVNLGCPSFLAPDMPSGRGVASRPFFHE